MHDSIVFSSKEADRLNSIVRQNIDSTLFLFAYYCPKNTLDYGELGFWKGITNVYSLFVDCAAFMKTGERTFLDILKTKGIISDAEFKKINKLMKLSDGIRSLFSHNNPLEYSRSNYNIDMLKKFVSEALSKEIDVNDINDVSLSVDEWTQCTKYLVDKSKECVSILEKALLSIAEYSEKNSIIREWKNIIIVWYKKKAPDLLYDALNNKLTLYLYMRQKMHARRQIYIKSWNERYRQKCLDLVDSFQNNEECKELLPIEFFNSLVDSTKPIEFWDNYFSISAHHRK